MKIITKFNVGDNVWCMYQDSPHQFSIYCIDITVNGGTSIKVQYIEKKYLPDIVDCRLYYRNEMDCYASKEELLRSFL